MKNRLKKFLVASLSTVCLLAHGQVGAMEEKSLESSQLSQSLILNVSDLSSFMSQEQIQQLLSRSQLSQSNMFSSSMIIQSPEEREFKRLQTKVDFPLDYKTFTHIINGILFPKYYGLSQTSFRSESSLEGNEYEQQEITDFLAIHKKSIEVINDATHLILAFKMLAEPFKPFQFEPQQHYYGYPPHFKIKSLFLSCSGMVKGQFTIKLNELYRGLKASIEGYYGWQHGSEQQIDKNKNLENLEKYFNDLLSFGGYKFNINKDAESVSEDIVKFFTITRQLAIFELNQWKYQKVNLDALLNDYATVEQQLEDATSGKVFFSGVYKTTYGIGLTKVQKQEQASDVEFLKNEVAAHHKADTPKLARYEEVKPHLSSLQKLVNWFDGVFGEVSKNGRMT